MDIPCIVSCNNKLLHYKLVSVKGANFMNQEKIGKFIAECRKKKNMTKQELAEKLGV